MTIFAKKQQNDTKKSHCQDPHLGFIQGTFRQEHAVGVVILAGP